MGDLIAVAGKGGVGKSTFSALLVRYLLKKGEKPLLVVDADPNFNLPAMLGIKPEETIGQVLEEFMGAKLTIPQGMSKQSFLELRLNQAVAEGKSFDLVVMGRPEGPGCYCSANAVLRDFLDRMRDNYKWIVVDNQAGMEHLSRRTEGKINYLLIVSDATVKGLRTVGNLLELVEELKLDVDKKYLVVNRANNLAPRLLDIIGKYDLIYLGSIPEDSLVIEFDLEEKSLLQLPDSSSAVKSSEQLLDKVFNQKF